MDRFQIKLICFLGLNILFAFSCTKKSNNENIVAEKVISSEVKTYKDLEQNKGKNVYVIGIIIKQEFVNKGGRATGIYETLLKLSDGETVHIRNKGKNQYDFEKFIDKKVKLEAYIFYGNIDSDNPEHQSRIGYRIDFTTMVEND